MYKSTEEMMAKLRCLNLVLKFKIHYSTHPIKVNYKGSAYKEKIPLEINSTSQIETINFEGFTPSDKKKMLKFALMEEISQLLEIEAQYGRSRT